MFAGVSAGTIHGCLTLQARNNYLAIPALLDGMFPSRDIQMPFISTVAPLLHPTRPGSCSLLLHLPCRHLSR
jgi:hypothetical protein